MSVDVKLRDDKFGISQLFLGDAHHIGELWEPLVQVTRPLAYDVVRKNNIKKHRRHEAVEQDKIHVCVTVKMVSDNTASSIA